MSKVLALVFATLTIAVLRCAPAASAQVSVNIGVAPACPYGYFSYAPYNCAPYGYYGRDPELKRFYRRKLVQKGLGKARVAAARKLGIRLWIMLRDQIDYQEFCRRGKARQESGSVHAGMPAINSGPAES